MRYALPVLQASPDKVTSKKIGNSLAWFLVEDEDEYHAVDPTDEFWTAEAYDGEAMRVSEIDDTIYR